MSRESRKLKRQQREAASRESWARKRKEEPGAFWTYVILRTIVILILIRSIWIGGIFSSVCPDADVNLLSGGQPVYYYLISAE